MALFSTALSLIDVAVYASVFPVLLVLCLARPEVRDQFPEFRAGFTPILTPLSEFLKSGGAAKCLTLKLIE